MCWGPVNHTPQRHVRWDPVGTWSIEGRTDATITISKVDDHYVIDAKSAYSRYKSIGYLTGEQLNMTYQAEAGFITYKRDRMSQVTFDTKGAIAWSGVLMRTSTSLSR